MVWETSGIPIFSISNKRMEPKTVLNAVIALEVVMVEMSDNSFNHCK
jgi:hypothetical protein